MKTNKSSYVRATLAGKNHKIYAEDLRAIEGMGRAKKTALAILNTVCDHPVINIQELADIIKVSKWTTTKIVKRLVDLEILLPMRKDKQRYQVYCYARAVGTAKELYTNDLSGQTRSGVWLNFDGRTEAIAQAYTPSSIKFKPDACHNRKQNNKNSRNTLYIADNIDCLKFMIKKKFKPFHLIFGDPVYNQKNARKTRHYQDTYDEHAGFLQFMYPRLMLCKELLDERGLLILSIGEDEVANTKLMCNEIFGEPINSIVVESGVNAGIYSSHSNKFLAETKFYLLVYAKNRQKIRFLNKLYDLVDKKFAKEYNTIITPDLKHEPLLDHLKREKWIIEEFADHKLRMTLNNIGKLMEVSQRFETHICEKIAPLLYKSTSPFKTYSKEAQKCPQNSVFCFDGKLLLKTENNNVVEFKPFLNRLQDNDGKKQNSIPRGTIWKNFQQFKNSIKSQAGIEFAGKKPLQLMMDILHWINNKNARVLDIFAGSGTTGYAIFAQNLKDGGHRCFTMCQIAEQIKEGSANPENFKTVDQKTILGLNNAIKTTGTSEGFKIYRTSKS